MYEKDSEKFVCALDNDSALLGSFPIDDGMRLHVSIKSAALYCSNIPE